LRERQFQGVPVTGPSRIAAVVAQVLRAGAVCAPLACLSVPPTFAQPAIPEALTHDIPAQPLARALTSFANQTGLQLVYVSGVLRNQHSQYVPQGLSTQEALERLLRGTGLRFEYLTPRTVRILVAPQRTLAPAPQELPNEVIVTASRRTEPLQDVPITVQVLTQATLSRLNITTFDELVGYLPGVTAHGTGPAQNNIYVRGLATGEDGLQGEGFNGTFPNVAVYLDEQSATMPGRNLDIYAADLERVELLEGPQGTLFGAGAEAGVLRYITNKPVLDATTAAVSGGYAGTVHGAPSNSLTAVLNVPLIDERLAVRAVIYDDRRGGYIDNLPGTFVRAGTDASIARYWGGVVPADSVVINNAALVADNINTVTYTGVRASAFYRFNDEWNALLMQSFQNMEADGLFAEEASDGAGHALPPLSVESFNPSYDKDRFENTALAVNGHVGDVRVLYAGSFLIRHVDQVQDYTNYARGGVYSSYYQCMPASPPQVPAAKCYSPSSRWHDLEGNTHLSQELRLTTPDDRRLRAVSGLFYEKFVLRSQTDWDYESSPYFTPVAPPSGYWTVNGSPLMPDGQVVCFCTKGAVFVPGAPTLNNADTRPAGVNFFNDVTRGYTQRAAYSSVDFDLIPHQLTLTAGTRYSRTYTWEVGADVGSFYCNVLLAPQEIPGAVPDPCRNRDITNLNALQLARTYSGFKSRANLSWKVDEDHLLYYTWSQGFRSGGFNRGFTPPENSPLYAGGAPWQAQATANGGYFAPIAYAPDTITNNELGWKTTWFNQRLQWNGAIYQENWDHAQIGYLAPTVLGNGNYNGGNYRVRGLSTTGGLHVTDGLTLESGLAWNHSALVKEAQFFWANGTPIDFSQLHVQGSNTPLVNPAGTLGSPLAGAPSFQGNVRARYEFPFHSYNAFVQLTGTHQSSSLANTDRLTVDLQGNSTAYVLPAYTTCNGAVGVSKDGWVVQLYGENLTDTRAQLYADYRQYYKEITTNRPRTIGIRFSYALGH
jgi:iron complex outermembrane recepter protein